MRHLRVALPARGASTRCSIPSTSRTRGTPAMVRLEAAFCGFAAAETSHACPTPMQHSSPIVLRPFARTAMASSPSTRAPALSHASLELLRRVNPSLRLLVADNASLVISFLPRVFIAPNVRSVPGPELASLLEDDLH